MTLAVVETDRVTTESLRAGNGERGGTIESTRKKDDGRGRRREFQVSSSMFQVAEYRLEISNLKFQISNFKFQISDFRFQISNCITT
jgi:hypothetical protein